MIKYLIFGAVSIALSFLFAGIVPSLFGCPERLRRNGNDGYCFYLGCALALTLGFSAVASVIGGYVILGCLYFVACIGGALAMAYQLIVAGSVNGAKGNGDAYDGVPFGESTSERCGNGGFVVGDKMAESACDCVDKTMSDDQRTDIGIGDEKSGSGLCVVDEMARYDEKDRISSYFKTLLFHNLRERVIYCSILFAVSAIILVLFGRFSDVPVAGSETGDDGVVEALVTFDGVTVTDEAIFLTADGGADVYALFGYATELVTASELAEAVDGGGTFTVRYTVMDEDEWSGYFRLLDIRDGNGACYLDGSGVISAREAAADQKMLVLGIITALCGAACFFYAVVWVKTLKKNGK